MSDVAAPGVHAGARQCAVELGQPPGDHQAAALLEGGGRAPDPLQPPQLLGLHLVADTAETVFVWGNYWDIPIVIRWLLQIL